MKTRISQDPEECRQIWLKTPPASFFDLWWVREAFAGAFRRPLHMVVAERAGEVAGALPLCWIEENRCFGYFPGETWRGKTWLEQNRIRTVDAEAVSALLEAVPEAAHIRYLVPESWHAMAPAIREDEVGYLFLPGCFGYDFQQYWHLFSGKSRKQLTREMSGLSAAGPSWRFDHFPDISLMFRMNLEGFGEYSYFSDGRFLAGFETLLGRLSRDGMLRITTLLLDGRVAAVDVGAVWNNTYTILAGGTSPEFPGVAKMINFHHLERACRERFDSVDFLCGDFGWKRRFHLTPRPLYELRPFSREDGVETSEAAACA